jgi:hypothetical protein
MIRSSLVAFLALGCGPVVILETGDGTATDGSSTHGGTGHDDGADSTATTSGALESCQPSLTPGRDPFGEGARCDAYFGLLDEPIPEITVRIVNQSDVPIVIPNFGDSSARYFELCGTIGGRVVRTVAQSCPLGWPTTPCASFGDDPPACNLPGNIPAPPVRLEPGGWLERPWSTWAVVEARLPGECIGDGAESELCSIPVVPGPGTYELVSEAVLAADCPGGCPCEPDEHGACEVDEAVPSPWSFGARSDWDGICDVVEIAFLF